MFDSVEIMKEAITSNENEGHIYTEKEKELLFEFALEKKTENKIWEALGINIKKEYIEETQKSNKNIRKIVDDKYVYEGTNVLINKLNIKEQFNLDIIERVMVAMKICQLGKQPLREKLDFIHLKKLHKYLFKELYYWAGKSRDVDISKGSSLFCKAIHIDSFAKDVFNGLEKQNNFKDIAKDKEVFSKEIALLYIEINALHPFREGNGRAQREFLKDVAKENGYLLRLPAITREKQTEFFQLGKENILELKNLIKNSLVEKSFS